jgi:hypothetical protein
MAEGTRAQKHAVLQRLSIAGRGLGRKTPGDMPKTAETRKRQQRRDLQMWFEEKNQMLVFRVL